jgi:Ran GTPase-activating protein (RanGAP) involved in mRNA processing and transport
VLDLSSNQLSRNAAGSLKRWLLAPACKLSKLVLERNQLGDDALALLASGLGANRTLTHLSLGSNRISHGGALALSNALGAALGARAAIKAPGCESVMPAWRTAHAKEIAARGVSRVGERELDAVGPTRRDRVGVNKTLRYLDLSNNPALGDAGALALANALRVNSALRSLLLADAGVGAPGAKALGDALSANGALVLLQLDRNGRIGDAGAAKLLRGLHGQTSLAHLSLCACGLTSPAAASIAAALIANDALERLELLGNRISDPGALVLGAALLQNTSLVTLDLSFNLLLSAASKAKLRAKWANGGRAPTGLTMY